MEKPEKPLADHAILGPWKIVGIFAVVVALWIVIGFGTFAFAGWYKAKNPSVTLSDSGTFGDTFGAVNSLFSALGVAGVAVALILQFKEQRDSRTEAQESRSHDAKMAMISASINGHAAIVNYLNDAYKRSQDQNRKTIHVGSENAAKAQERLDFFHNSLLQQVEHILNLLNTAHSHIDHK